MLQQLEPLIKNTSANIAYLVRDIIVQDNDTEVIWARTHITKIDTAIRKIREPETSREPVKDVGRHNMASAEYPEIIEARKKMTVARINDHLDAIAEYDKEELDSLIRDYRRMVYNILTSGNRDMANTGSNQRNPRR